MDPSSRNCETSGPSIVGWLNDIGAAPMFATVRDRGALIDPIAAWSVAVLGTIDRSG